MLGISYAVDTVEKGKEREDGRVGYVAAETKAKSKRPVALAEVLKIFFHRNDGRKKGEARSPIEN